MNETTAEALILAINALGAGLLFFIAGVVQKVMDDMDEAGFKRFLNALDRAAMTNAFVVTIATLPILAAVPYFVVYGFHHAWFTAGIVAWTIGSTITKISNLPVYRWVGDPENNDPVELRKQRKVLARANKVRAWVTLGSVVLMACQFGVREAALVVAFSVLVAFPLLWLARKYLPN